MDRYTDDRLLCDGYYKPKSKAERDEMRSKKMPTYDELYKQLGKYEHTGLMPDEIPQLKSEVERLTAENDVLKSECKAHARKQADLFKGYQGMKDENATLKKALIRAEDDFTDFVGNGANNPAPYCLNNCEKCVDKRGWCKQGQKACKGFTPSFISQAQQVTQETHGDDKSAVTSITCYGEGEDFE